MYRLLIADDEALEREGIEWIVTRMMPDTFEIIHAENGRIAIQKAEELRPHIILMDVKMPGIHGLEALKEIKAHHPQIKMVLVTAYEYFEYAKEALSLGVKEYVVKPAKRDHIVALLQRLVAEIEQDLRKRDEELAMRDKLFQLLPLAETELALVFMSDQVNELEAGNLAELLGLSINQGCAVVLALPELGHISERELGQEKKRIYESVKTIAKGVARDRIGCVVSSMVYWHMAIFLLEKPHRKGEMLGDEAQDLGIKLLEQLRVQRNIEAAIGIGSVGEGVEGIKRSYFEAVFASTYHKKWGTLCRFGDLHMVSMEGQREAAEKNTERTYVELAIKQIREEREQRTWSVVDNAITFIKSKFHEDLSLEEAAEHVHLNPYYFSKVFKQQTGETFIDYVTGLRIEKAKAYIREGQLSLKEVCYVVGYKDPNYFSRVFKKVTGATPTEYRNQVND
ncbi:response regulator transcription factor [Paenibacillus aceris]|uniref:Two-component system response regulator YesN n=1 Tax=Paenibacillus aceris TaxID=869555 RepID=A0ABS4HYX1_9BACL|nr:AraC family transcriptional regulator [Paenibacillus aceris]MBP1963857.1 two-component system response regulator YesN [Paenibacillus aceris]NHW34722.1 response regulator [Paenibacillus aceris]